MHNLKPITDLENYQSVLNDVSADSPVYLTENGKECFVLSDMRDYEKQKAALQLSAALLDGETSVCGYLKREGLKCAYA